MDGKRVLAAAAMGLWVSLACVAQAPAERSTSVPEAVLENGSFTADLNGRRIHYEVHGSGPVLMALTNSWGLSLEGLRGLYGPLEKSFTLVTFDPRGMGSSGPVQVPSDMGMAAVREDFQALRVHLGLDRVNAIGWSNGAINLILLASENPGTLSSAIFVHGVPAMTEADEQAMARSRPEDYKKYGRFFRKMAKARLYPESAAQKTKAFFVDEAFPSMTADPKSARPLIGAAFKDAGFSWEHLSYSNREMPTFDFRDRLAAIDTRCLVIAGAHDLLPPDRVKEIADGVPGARFVLFEHSGHFSPLEEPEAFANAVRSFVAAGDGPETRIVELERWAMERWAGGDPSPFLSLCARDVTYFDNRAPHRVDGLDALRAILAPLKGTFRLEGFEMEAPRVQVMGGAAVLTYTFVARMDEGSSRWHATEVYRKDPGGWRIASSHWSPAAGDEKARN
jgi:pimeloyl-ACP methyl ester carboxylesterase